MTSMKTSNIARDSLLSPASNRRQAVRPILGVAGETPRGIDLINDAGKLETRKWFNAAHGAHPADSATRIPLIVVKDSSEPFRPEQRIGEVTEQQHGGRPADHAVNDPVALSWSSPRRPPARTRQEPGRHGAHPASLVSPIIGTQRMAMSPVNAPASFMR